MTALKSYTLPNPFLFGAPLSRSLETALETSLHNLVEAEAPAYDIIQQGDSHFTITVAVPGLDESDIEITEHKGRLGISFKSDDSSAATPPTADQSEDGTVTVLRQGIQTKRAALDFKLGEHVRVEAASLDKGLLSVALIRDVPTELQPRHIPIHAAA